MCRCVLQYPAPSCSPRATCTAAPSEDEIPPHLRGLAVGDGASGTLQRMLNKQQNKIKSNVGVVNLERPPSGVAVATRAANSGTNNAGARGRGRGGRGRGRGGGPVRRASQPTLAAAPPALRTSASERTPPASRQAVAPPAAFHPTPLPTIAEDSAAADDDDDEAQPPPPPMLDDTECDNDDDPAPPPPPVAVDDDFSETPAPPPLQPAASVVPPSEPVLPPSQVLYDASGYPASLPKDVIEWCVSVRVGDALLIPRNTGAALRTNTRPQVTRSWALAPASSLASRKRTTTAGGAATQ